MMYYVACLVIYVLMLIGVSIYSKSRTKNVEDYALAGRSVPPWVSAFSYGTAYFSAVILIGHAGKNGWTFGMSAFWVVVGNAFIGTYLPWRVLAKRTREMTQRLSVTTMPQFIETRYDWSFLKYLAAVVIFIFLVPYASSVYTGLGYLFETTFGIDETIIVLIMSVVTAIYVFAGGFLAASLADFIQGIIMVIGVVLIFVFILKDPNVGGLSGGIAGLKAIDVDLTRILPADGTKAFNLIALVVMTSLGTWGLPQMISKFYSIKDEKSVKTARRASTAFSVLITTGAYTMGVFAPLIINGNNALDRIMNGETMVFDRIVPNVIAIALPKFLIGILLIVILAASMSTLASIVLASSTTFVMDLIKPLAGGRIDNKKELALLRFFSVVFIVVAAVCAIGQVPILTLHSLSWGYVAGVLLAPYFVGLYYKDATKAGALVSMISAILIMIGGQLLGFNMTATSAVAIVVPNFVHLAVSKFTKKFDKKHIAKIYNM